MILSDGKITRSFSDLEERGPIVPAPDTLTKDAIATIVRLGLGPLSFSVLRPSGKERFVPFAAVGDSFRYTDPVEGDDGDWKTLSYTVKTRDGSVDVTVKLWYEPASSRLIKRTVVQRDKSRGAQEATELYKEFLLNAPIPADEFRVPGDR
jgi:hypothetical protein